MTEAQLLDGQAFNRLVLENDLAGKTWEENGYIYAGLKGKDGWELYRCYGPKWCWMYQARRVLTSPVGGGVLALRFSVTTGMTFELQALYVQGPVTNTTLTVYRRDEDGAQNSLWASIAAGATREVNLPSIGAAASSNGNLGSSLYAKLGPGEYVVASAAASAQTETLTIGLVGYLPINATVDSITWATTGSAAGATLGANTISTPLQAVLMP